MWPAWQAETRQKRNQFFNWIIIKLLYFIPVNWILPICTTPMHLSHVFCPYIINCSKFTAFTHTRAWMLRKMNVLQIMLFTYPDSLRLHEIHICYCFLLRSHMNRNRQTWCLRRVQSHDLVCWIAVERRTDWNGRRLTFRGRWKIKTVRVIGFKIRKWGYSEYQLCF